MVDILPLSSSGRLSGDRDLLSPPKINLF